MTWFRIDDGFHSHPKVLRAGNAALGLWTRCGAYASHYLTDGFIPAETARSFGTRAEAAALVAAGLWIIEPDGFRMHDFHDHNPAADDVRARRAADAERKRQGRSSQSSARNPHGHPPDVPPESDGPVPSRPVEVLTSSSVSTGVAANGTDDDDDDRFSKVVELVVAGKERDHPPTRNGRAWRKIVTANTALEDGQVIRRLLADGDTPEAIALFVLGHGDSTKVDRDAKPWCDTTCATCDGTGWLYDADLDGAVPCPNR